MLDLSFSEMLVAGTVALVVLGPQRLPKAARTVGGWVGKIQRLAANVKSELAKEADLADLQRIKTEVENAARDIRAGLNAAEAGLPAWERLPELKTPADFGIDTDVQAAYAQRRPETLPLFHSTSLRKQAMARRRSHRPRPRPAPKLRSRR